jgi:hypothetical protein
MRDVLDAERPQLRTILPAHLRSSEFCDAAYSSLVSWLSNHVNRN